MNVAVVTTTIHVPEVLKRYAAMPEEPIIIVAGDLNTPDECETFCHDIDATYLSPSVQEHTYRELSNVIGWRCIQRRNVAILAAARARADVIVTVDDDNVPLTDWYVADHVKNLTSTPHAWWTTSSRVYDPGQQLHAEGGRVFARGMPYDESRYDLTAWTRSPVDPVDTAVVGASAGLWLGDPDIDAIERLYRRPEVTAMRDVVTIAPGTFAPINSQNTAWRAELGVLMGCLPGVGRYDDIWGSYIACKVMADLDYGVVFGDPLVRQDRNDHDLVKDLEDEVYGYRHTPRLLDLLMNAPSYDGPDVVGAYRHAVTVVAELLPPQALRFAEVWADEWEKLS